jgi:hypothetical protein
MTRRSLLFGALAFVVLLALVYELAKTSAVTTSLTPVVVPPPPNMADYR